MKDPVVAFDFDGVICDSTEECLITGYNAWLRYQKSDGFVINTDGIPAGIAEYFRIWRGLVRTAGQYFVIFNSCEILKLNSEYDFEHECAAHKMESRIYEKLFFEARDKLRTQNSDYWINLHHTYEGISRDFKRLSEWADVFVVTGKDSDSVKTFLKHIGIEISESRIYDKNAAADKLAALKAISKNTNKKLSDVTFLDDNVYHLLAPKESGCKTYMAGWGYHSEEHLALARRNDIEVLDLGNWYARISRSIKRDPQNKKNTHLNKYGRERSRQ